VGAQLVGAAFAFAADAHAAGKGLKPNEHALLMFMALTALDTDASPRYFAAREQSAFALGRRVPDEPDPDDPDAESIEAERRAAFERVRAATQGLVKAGAIKSVRRGRAGQRAMYQLTLSR